MIVSDANRFTQHNDEDSDNGYTKFILQKIITGRISGCLK